MYAIFHEGAFSLYTTGKVQAPDSHRPAGTITMDARGLTDKCDMIAQDSHITYADRKMSTRDC